MATISLIVAPGILLVAALIARSGPVVAVPSIEAPAALARGEPILAIVVHEKRLGPKERLGRQFFVDARLSGDSRTSCQSCHDLGSNGAFAGTRQTVLDTPTVYNAALNRHLGWEGRGPSLEWMVIATLKCDLMTRGVDLSTRLNRLRRDAAVSDAFERVYGRPLDALGVAQAIAAFERTLVTPSRFDQWLSGQSNVLSREEREGYALFKRLGCVSCHQGRNIGGNLRQRHGIFRPLAAPNPRILRVPSLRNVAVTPPYFHDGSAPTLDDAVQRMAAAQLNVDLSREDNRRIVAFLQSLTGEYKGRRLEAPR
ncbi:cytochrome-c peroxidase [Novosphingobium sp. AP12]|uniref:cytochrome-c peroxidase n=1 Tax=Novosphingobium sp. AP12 TaxID=1144305 RepID=UPI00031B93B1|nr:cytochrome c peroxidase [Novosphingobium sp. AP12]